MGQGDLILIELGILEVKKNTQILSLMIPVKMGGYELYQLTVKDNKIVIIPASPTCPFCGRLGVKELSNYYVCLPCIDNLKKIRRKRK